MEALIHFSVHPLVVIMIVISSGLRPDICKNSTRIGYDTTVLHTFARSLFVFCNVLQAY